MSIPLVSVCVITYNQQSYIEQCLRSILSQKCDFEWEIILNDDNSSDGTSEICREISGAALNIRYTRNAANLGMMGNWIDSLKKAQGKYIALCEGDDYWTDSNKLQKQVSFLEAHPEFAGCFHNTEERYEEDDTKASHLYCGGQDARRVGFRELAVGNLIPTCSAVFRNHLFDDFPDWYWKLRMADWPLHLLNAQSGDYWYFPKVMAVHRLHTASTWMLQDALKNNGYVIDAYDALIGGFGHNAMYTGYLAEGKANFQISIAPARKSGFKTRVKNLMIRVIHKI